MRERVLIAVGLALFVGLLSFPVWWAAGSGLHATAAPIQLPKGSPDCVAPVSYMRSSHMELLDRWRTDAVRRGVRQVRLADGRTYDASLSRTCLDCHSKVEFCDSCHTYAGVSAPSCWQCHNDPQQTARRAP
jgi:hypothetical protein